MAARRLPGLGAQLLRGLQQPLAAASEASTAAAAGWLKRSAADAGLPAAASRCWQAPPGWQAARRGFASLPPHTEMAMPALSPTMSQGNIAKWKKKEGDEVVAGDVLAEIETDKATMDWEAQDEGFLARILVQEGAKDVPVGTPVAVMVEDQDTVGAFADYQPGSGGGGTAPAAASAAAEQDEEPAAAAPREEAPPADEESAGGGGGDWPPYSVMGMPALSPTMSQGNIAAWKKKEGDEFAAGDSLAEIETDKATMDWESQDDGFVAKVLVAEGAKDVPVGEPVMITVEDQESVGAFANFTAEDAKGKPKPKKAAAAPAAKQDKAPASQPKPQAPPAKQEAPAAKPAAAAGGRVVASPYARKLAREAGVDLSQARASGPNGRIVAADVQQLISLGGGKAGQPQQQQQPATAAPQAGGQAPAQGYGDFSDVSHTQIRRVTARRLLEAKQTIPHYYLTMDCTMDKLLALRAQLNGRLKEGGAKLSVNDFIIKASALALRKVPGVNASWQPDFIRQFHNVDIGVAVQTDIGLMVPVLRDADALGLAEVSAAVKALAGKAKEGKLSPADMGGGTFTISNLGMYGITQFAAIINPPQAAILAVGAAQPRVVAAPGGGYAEASVMAATLSCDHRVVDGAMGAQWLQAFKGYIEDPVTMLL